MSIYIANMDIPKDEAIALYIYPDGRVKLWRPQDAVSHEYKAVSVPPHGDLIDRDPFIEFIKTHWNSYGQWFVKQLKARPTIIPAEEGE